MDWERKSDQEIFDQLRKAELAAKVQDSEEWGLIHEAMRRVYEKHVDALIKVDPGDKQAIIELQQICKIYGEKFFPALLENYQAIGEYAFNEARDRGVLSVFLGKIKKAAYGL